MATLITDKQSEAVDKFRVEIESLFAIKEKLLTRGIFPFPENYQNLKIVIGIIFKLNYGKRK